MSEREYSDEAVRALAFRLAAYLREPDNLGASLWMKDRAIGWADRVAIMVALSDMEDEMPRVFERQLAVPLTQGELVERGWSLSEEQKKKQKLERDKKAAADEFKVRIETVEEEIGRLTDIVHGKAEYRPVPCHQQRDYKRGVVEVVRRDTGEIVETRVMTDTERQQKLVDMDEDVEVGVSPIETPEVPAKRERREKAAQA